MNVWVRLWHEMPTDPKWRVIARKSGRPTSEIVAVFTMMLVNASQSEDRGTLENWDDEDVAAALDMDTEYVTAIRQAMQGKVLDGDSLTGWDRRQPKREDETLAARVKRHRESVTQCNAEKRSVTQNPIDKDTDKDKDAEADTEQKQKTTAALTDPHQYAAETHLRTLCAKYDPSLTDEMDKHPPADYIQTLVNIAQYKLGRNMVNGVTAWEAAEKALEWMQRDKFWRKHASVLWLLDVKNGGQQALVKIKERSQEALAQDAAGDKIMQEYQEHFAKMKGASP